MIFAANYPVWLRILRSNALLDHKDRKDAQRTQEKSTGDAPVESLWNAEPAMQDF